MQTKTIGLIGGIGWASTLDYYRPLNEAVVARLGPAVHNVVTENTRQAFIGFIDKLVADGAEAVILRHRFTSQRPHFL